MAAQNNRLQMADQFRFLTLVQSKYTEMGLSDSEFAAWAAKELNLPVGKAHVASAREAFKIPPSRVSKELGKALPNAALLSRIDELESLFTKQDEDIARLTAHVQHLLQMERGRK